MFSEPNLFSYLELEPQTSASAKKSNLERVQEALDDFFSQTNQVWSDSSGSRKSGPHLNMIVKSMIGIALKSQKAGEYINEIMGLEQENQEELGAIV